MINTTIKSFLLWCCMFKMSWSQSMIGFEFVLNDPNNRNIKKIKSFFIDPPMIIKNMSFNYTNSKDALHPGFLARNKILKRTLIMCNLFYMCQSFLRLKCFALTEKKTRMQFLCKVFIDVKVNTKITWYSVTVIWYNLVSRRW